MGKPDIEIMRIDSRLVHGQVGVAWAKHAGANLVVVANDEAAKNSVYQSLMTMAVPGYIGIRFFTVEDSKKILFMASKEQRILLIVKSPEDARELLKADIGVKSINVGNMDKSEGKRMIGENIYVDDEDEKAFRDILDMGVELEIRLLPDSKSVDIREVL